MNEINSTKFSLPKIIVALSELFQDKSQMHVWQVFQILCLYQDEATDVFMDKHRQKMDSSVVHVHDAGSVRTMKHDVE